MPTTEELTSSLNRAVSALESLSARQAKLEADAREPIAILGIGCRYPGAIVNPESFWRVLDQGLDPIERVPSERWDVDSLYDPDPDAPGKVNTREGGFLLQVADFDHNFFGLSRSEAERLDPQQRLLLETTWEALEHAGIVPASLSGTGAAVFVGLMQSEYPTIIGDSLEALDGHVSLGNAGSVASGRISYFLGLRGPSLTLDTACSSSSVALHLACQSLRQGECSIALAGGVTLMLTPGVVVEFSRLRGLASDGRCKSFSGDADGTSLTEGCGIVVLERLSDARRHNHPVLALILGSAVNQDGRSQGLSAPNGPAQEAVILQALAKAGLSPADIDYIEGHGTGTRLGDPIELQALGGVFAATRSAENALMLGSLKSNLGHTQAAAGVGGVIKVVLSMQHRRIPKSLHFTSPTPYVDWDELRLKVVSESRVWVAKGRPRRAGVSSFGISGTNAHLVLEEPPREELDNAPPERVAELVLLSAKSPAALDAAAARLYAHVQAHPEIGLGDLAASLARTRTHFVHRAAFAASSRDRVLELLEHMSHGAVPGGVVRSVAKGIRKVAWLFPGQGAQQLGMGRGLYDEWPAFREALQAVFAAVDPYLERPLRQVMWAPAGSAEAALLDQTRYAQPALFAMEWALQELWRSWGLAPDVVVGHSLGELVAACVASVFSLEDACRLVVARGRLMQALPAQGVMMSVALSEAATVAELAAWAPHVSISAVNGPESVVISGLDGPVSQVARALGARGVKTKRLQGSHGFHSSLMEPMLKPFRAVAETLAYREPSLPIVSTATGTASSAEIAGPDYWVQQVRKPVRFFDAILAIGDSACVTFVELASRPTLLGAVSDCLPDMDPTLVSSLHPGFSEPESALQGLGQWHAGGGEVEWGRVFPGRRQHVALPTYPWQRKRCWIDEPLDSGTRWRPPGGGRVGNRSAPGGSSSGQRMTRVFEEIRERCSGMAPATTLADAGIDSLAIAGLRAELVAYDGGRLLAKALGPHSRLSDLLAFIGSSSTGLALDASAVATILEKADWITVTPESVNKHSAENVLLSRCSRGTSPSGELTVAELRMHRSHAFFYDHPLDHVPGLYLIEGARQLGNWLLFSSAGELAAGGTLDRVEADFFEFVEHDVPAFLIAAPEANSFTAQVFQSEKRKAIISIMGRRIATDEYLQLRASQRERGP